MWLSPVERTVRVREVPSSNLGTPTCKETPNPRESFVLRFRFPIEGHRKSRHPDMQGDSQPEGVFLFSGPGSPSGDAANLRA